MKFTKFGKALLMSALSVGVVLSVASCVQSYSVGYLYVTGTATANPSGSGYVAGFKIDHNTGKLTPVNGLNPPVPSGGANPVRAVLLPSGSRFLYVLNRGANKEGNGDCTTDDPCLKSNITQFAVGANGILTPQQTFTTQGLNPFRMITDSQGIYIFVLEHDSQINNLPSSPTNPNPNCQAGLGKDPATKLPITVCGDITAFLVDQTTGRLQLVTNQAGTTTLGATLPYFPVPANAVDFVLSSGGYVLTLTATPATASASYPYTGGATVFPYLSSSGQLTTTGTGYPYDVLNIAAGTAIVNTTSNVFVLDNEPITVNGVVASQSQILPYGPPGANGALIAATTGPIPDDANQSNPIYLAVDKALRFYVANQGNNAPTLAQSGIAGYNFNNPFDPKEINSIPVGSGSGAGPQCLVEDPSDQFFYTANINDSSVTGQSIDQVGGALNPLSQSSKVPDNYALPGPPTWCLVDGRTN